MIYIDTPSLRIVHIHVRKINIINIQYIVTSRRKLKLHT